MNKDNWTITNFTPLQWSELWMLNPVGDEDSTIHTVNNILRTILHTSDNTLLSIEVIIDRFRNYIEWWMVTYGTKDPKYIPEKQKLKTIAEWANDYDFNKTYEISKTARDYYLFGDLSTTEIKAALKSFKNG